MRINLIEFENRITPMHIVIFSLIVIIIIIFFSSINETRSQRLPAVVKTEKKAISAKTSGIAVNYKVALNEHVQQNQFLFEMENKQIQNRLIALKNERSKYEEVINSAKSGDHLEFKISNIEKELILLENLEVEFNLKKEKISNQLEIYSKQFESAEANYQVYEDLFNKKHISLSEFDERTSNYLIINNSYQSHKNDLQLINKEIKSNAKEIALIEQQKKLFRENVTLLVDKYVLELAKIDNEINEIEVTIGSLSIYSPSNGYVTKLNFNPGENVKEGDEILELSSVNKIWIIAFGNSFSRQKITNSMKVKVHCTNGKKIYGKIKSISPVMERESSLSEDFETVSSYTKIEISLDNNVDATNNLTPGERLFVSVYFR